MIHYNVNCSVDVILKYHIDMKITYLFTFNFVFSILVPLGSFSLWEANKAMMREMQKLRGEKSQSSSSMSTPAPKISAPSPAGTPVPRTKEKEKKKEKVDPKDVQPPADRPAPQTEGAKLNRLRRLCEMKPSGRCHVPKAIHEKWAKSTRAEKEAMIDELEKVNWSKDWL